MALLAYLAVTGEYQSRDTLAALLWPEMEQAVAPYRDHFLSGFSLRDSAEFDDWQLAVTEQLRRSYSTAPAWLVQTHSHSGEYEQAIDLTHRWLAVDPLREEAHRRLMQLYAWSGVRYAASRQYREAIRVLDEELGGQDAIAADFYRRAGDHARSLYANREALGHYQTALALGHSDAVALHEAAGDIHTTRRVPRGPASLRVGRRSGQRRRFRSIGTQAGPGSRAPGQPGIG